MSNYILVDKKAVLAPDLMKWGEWHSDISNRRVAQDYLDNDKIRISTVFLGIDHAYDHGPLMLFETMIFGGEHDDYCDRCETWEQAEEMHKKAMALVNKG